jgi:ABC-type Fe3+/spermidine/putrescine transport system ATPase subunit
LRQVDNFAKPTAGTIEIGGKDVGGLTGAARGVAMVLQSYALLPYCGMPPSKEFAKA